MHPIETLEFTPDYFATGREIKVMGSPCTLLLVEDNNADATLVRRALSRAQIAHQLQVVPRGEEAIAYLAGSGFYSNRQLYPLPVLVLLDLELRGIDGFEVLAWIRSQDYLRHLQVVILSGSGDPNDFAKARAMGADSFILKTGDFKEVVQFVKAFWDFWHLVEPPSNLPSGPRVTD